MRCLLHPGRTHITVIGELASLAPGSYVEAQGQWENRRPYPKSFRVLSFQEIPAPTVDGVVAFLSSGIIKGIGKVLAKRIVNFFGADTVSILDRDISLISQVPGISRNKAESISAEWNSTRGVRRVLSFLEGNGLSPTMALRTHRILGDNAVALVKADPYCLVKEVDGIGFATADAMALRMGFTGDDVRRVEAGIKAALERFVDDGNVYALRNDVEARAGQILGVAREAIVKGINCLEAKSEVVLEGERVFPAGLYWCEKESARMLWRLMRSDIRPLSADVKPARAPEGIVYDELQQTAIEQAAASKVFVLTGGPGTGKTTTVQGILSVFTAQKRTVLLAAPTGRAAKRLSQTTGMEAKTIHRLLEYTAEGGFMRNEDNFLEGDVLIVDESSMIDITLFYNLLKAVPKHMCLILAGDVDQLPSVGAGNVLADIIASDCIPVVRLTRIFRQALSSRIITNAHAVNAGRFPDISNGKHSDFFFIAKNDDEIAPAITDLLCRRLPNTYGVSPEDIQVLTPMTRGQLGTAALNSILHDAINPCGAAVENVPFRIGDKVIQIRNNYEKNVFNGDMGIVTGGKTKDSAFTVEFDCRRVGYTSAEADELMLAYAVTVHKSQGSEFPIVVIPLTLSHSVMLQRNLIYTAITRAKKVCILIGDERALARGVENRPVGKRFSSLAERLITEVNEANC